VLVTYLSGIVDERDQVVLGGYPGVFRVLLGVRVDELYPLPAGEEVRVEGLPHSPLTARDWSEHVETTTAVAIARYADGPLHDAPAITRRRVGDGTATYVSTGLDDLGMQSLADDLIRVSDLQPLVAEAPPFVELTVRETDAASYAFLINHGTVEAYVELDGTDLVTGGEFGCNLPAGDVAIVRLR
jgi:beta-galactosidase